MIFYIFVVKNSYLIYILLKKSIFWERFLQHSVHFCKISSKNLKTKKSLKKYLTLFLMPSIIFPM